MDILLGLRHIRPNSSFTMLDDTYESLIWEDENTTKPTLAEIEAGYNEYQAQYQATQYQRDRAKAYAPLAEQLDMQYHDTMNGTETWLDHIRSVKAVHPKEGE